MRLPVALLFLTLSSFALADDSALDVVTQQAEQGDIDAQYYLAFQYELGIEVVQNNRKAYYWYSKAAEKGDARSQYALGYLYTEGIGVRRSLEQAKTWYEKASQQHYPEAQYALANLYYSGTNGLEINYSLAKELYGKACDNGQWEACEEYSKLQSLGI